MKNTIWIVPIEPIDSRYTKQWYDHIPGKLRTSWNSNNFIVEQLYVEPVKEKTTEGAFLDFGYTNVYKARQIERLGFLFSTGHVQKSDRFLVTDAWSTVIPSIRYMSDLLNIPVEIHGIWHAGAYDPSDILGMKMDKKWANNFERACYYACDFNYFATNFHKNMFMKNLEIDDESKAILAGQPHQLLIDEIEEVRKDLGIINKDIDVVWPHRNNGDKQPEIALMLKSTFPHLKWYFTYEHNLTKKEYYRILLKSKVAFSCALHENLGIAMMEATLCDCLPLVPTRASYNEMYIDPFKYPSEWTESFNNATITQKELIDKIVNLIEETPKLLNTKIKQKNHFLHHFLNPGKMFYNLTRDL